MRDRETETKRERERKRERGRKRYREIKRMKRERVKASTKSLDSFFLTDD